MVKPQLPEQIAMLIPDDILRIINSYTPHLPKKPSPKTSPSLQRELTRIQSACFKGKSAMYLRGFDDFILDMHDCY